MNAENTAVLTVDLHRGHLDPEIATLPVPTDQATEILDAATALVKTARSSGLPIIHVTTAYRNADEILTNPKWRKTEEQSGDSREAISKHNVYGETNGMDIMPALLEESDTVLQPKKRYSPFLNTDLEFVLRTNGISNLLIAGVNTNTCVQCTCFEATNRDFDVTVVEECVGSMDGEDFHQLGLKNIGQALGSVVSLESILELLESELNSDHE